MLHFINLYLQEVSLCGFFCQIKVHFLNSLCQHILILQLSNISKSKIALLGAYLHFNSETYKSNLFCLQVSNSDVTFPHIMLSIKITELPSVIEHTYIFHIQNIFISHVIYIFPYWKGSVFFPKYRLAFLFYLTLPNYAIVKNCI